MEYSCQSGKGKEIIDDDLLNDDNFLKKFLGAEGELSYENNYQDSAQVMKGGVLDAGNDHLVNKKMKGVIIEERTKRSKCKICKKLCRHDLRNCPLRSYYVLTGENANETDAEPVSSANEYEYHEYEEIYGYNYGDEDAINNFYCNSEPGDINQFGETSKANEESNEDEHFVYEEELYCPEVSDDLKPKIGQVFNSYDESVQMYKRYAFEGGFDVRQGTRTLNDNRVVLVNYLLCNRQGRANTSQVDTMDIQKNKIKRRRDFSRCECDARITFHVIPGTLKYLVFEFKELHNHTLISKENMYLSRASRQVDSSKLTFIYNLAKQNIGATRAYRFMAGIQGGYGRRGGLAIDWKNKYRNLNCFIGGRDAKMLVDKMENRKKHVSNFTFEFRDNGGLLDAMFWADETAKFHYNVFGDVVSFDATYSTNRYNMVLVPFTGIDNHGKCVNFGAGLISREDTGSYVWLLKSFLKAFGKEPILVVTDQDPAMKNAIQEVFPKSNHRLCMWHITSKISKKVSWEIANNSSFKQRFHGLVWNSKIDAHQFETGWEKMLVDFKLVNNTWLHYVFGIRRSWIPAFFKSIPMAGLMKTTSLSESANWSFQNTTLTGSYLVHFMNSFEATMEKQRHDQHVNDFNTTTSFPVMITYLPYERQAARVYTRRIFYQVQEEIFQSEKSCFQKNVVTGENIDYVYILESKKSISTRKELHVGEDKVDDSYSYDHISYDSEFKVTHDKQEGSFSCSCMNFEHLGVLCRHIFCVLKFYRYESIPERYVLKRWCRDVIPSEIIRRRFKYLDMEESVEIVAMDINAIVEECVAALSHDEHKLRMYLDEQRKLKDTFGIDSFRKDSVSKDSQYEKLLGVTVPDVVDIQNPIFSKNKGHGSRGKRLKSKREMKAKETEKPKRQCHLCKQYVHHDKRNCPLKNQILGAE